MDHDDYCKLFSLQETMTISLLKIEEMVTVIGHLERNHVSVV